MNDLLRDFLTPLNETTSSAIVIIAASLLLYNLSRNQRNRVSRTSAVLLACVTIPYASEVLLELEPGIGSASNILRFQWLGLAFLPTATFHLSDALLDTTGLPSRGRRRRVIRVLYALSAMFLLLAAFSDLVIEPEIVRGRVSMRAGALFWPYLLFFLIVSAVAFLNVNRARKRCLTRSTERRMAYLQASMLSPAVGAFPYSVLLPPGEEFSLPALLLVNAANLLLIFMLLFLAYPLSFFGSQIPDRAVKARLLRFMMLGPGTGVLALAVVVFTAPTGQLIGIDGQDFLPFGVVAVILLWQWFVDLALPPLERLLIYNEEDDEQIAQFANLGERLLTRADLLQLVDANLEACCDYLRVNRAFVAMINDSTPEMVRSVGNHLPDNEVLRDETLLLLDTIKAGGETDIQHWDDFWVLPLFSHRVLTVEGVPLMVGLMAVEARGDLETLPADDRTMLETFARRAARTLDDLLLQSEIYAALSGLLPQITLTRSRAAEVEFRPGYDPLPSNALVLNRDEIVQQVQAALRHYWGGPGLSSSRLMELVAVRHRLPANENNPVRALRELLQEAIEYQRPEGERDMRSPEWTLYNILDLRFIEKKKVKETARRLFMSEANLYRKQSVAIEAVADALIKIEQEAQSNQRIPTSP